MKKAIICFFIGSVLTVFCQVPSLQLANHISPEEARDGDSKQQELFTGNKDEFIVGDYTKNGIIYTSYNSISMEKTGTFNIEDLIINGERAECAKRIFYDDKIASLYHFIDKISKEFMIYGKITDRKNNIIKKETVLISSKQDPKVWFDRYKLTFSNDNSKFYLYREIIGGVFEEEKVQMALYDRELNKIYEKYLSFPVKKKAFDIEKILLTKDGNVVILASMMGGKPKDLRIEEKYTTKIFAVRENKEEFFEIEFADEGNKLVKYEGFVKDDSTGNIFLTGFISDWDDHFPGCCYMRGYYYLRVNTNTWETETIKYNKISTETLNSFYLIKTDMSKSEKKSLTSFASVPGYSSLLLNDYFLGADGSMKIIYEVNTARNTAMSINWNKRSPHPIVPTENRGLRDDYSYHYLNILEFNINSEGELSAPIIIPKDQIMCQMGYHISHFTLMSGDKTFYIFNDAENNYDAEKVAKKDNNNSAYSFFSLDRKNRLCYATVEDKVNISKTPMVNTWESNVLITPGAAVKLDDQCIISWGKIPDNKNLILVKVFIK